MSKPFDYSKWDNIELSDDEDDVHPNIDRESWFRMKHRSRVEREQNEEADKKRIREAMEKADKRIELLTHDLKKLAKLSGDDDDDSDSDDDDLDGRVAIESEIKELKKENEIRQNKLDEYEKNKKWNVDNMCTVKEERTIINPSAGKTNYTETGFAKSTVEAKEIPTGLTKEDVAQDDNTKKEGSEKKVEAKPAETKKSTTTATTTTAKTTTSSKEKAAAKPTGPEFSTTEKNTMYTYHEFTVKYADTVELFMKIPDLEGSKDFLLKYGDILLQENASNYLLLASLEDEMNGYREKMKQTARQSQIISNIADLAKQLNTHPGNVILPFFNRMQSQREYLDGFNDGVNSFIEKIIKRAVTKKIEMDRQRREEAGGDEEAVDLEDVPKEQRLGPGGLDPLEVIPTLPKSMQKAFESRNVEDLKEALMKLDPKDAEYHMKRCIDSGLWVAQA